MRMCSGYRSERAGFIPVTLSFISTSLRPSHVFPAGQNSEALISAISPVTACRTGSVKVFLAVSVVASSRLLVYRGVTPHPDAKLHPRLRSLEIAKSGNFLRPKGK